jgi:hypothetical protein
MDRDSWYAYNREYLHFILSSDAAVKNCDPDIVTADFPELGATLGLIALGSGVG